MSILTSRRYNHALVQGFPSRESVLVIVSDAHLTTDEVNFLQKLSSNGAKIIAWQHTPIVQERLPSPDVTTALAKANLKSIPLANALGEPGDIEAEEAVIEWMKALGPAALSPEGSFRSLFRYRRLSLWWWAELFLYHETPLRLYVRDIEVMARLLEKERPDRVVVIGPVRDLGKIATRMAANVEIHGSSRTGPIRRGNSSLHFVTALVKMMGTSLKTVFRPGHPRAGESRRRLLFVTHASMWKEKPEEEFAEMFLDAALQHRGVPLPRRTLQSFRDTFLLQLPWAIRSYLEIEATIKEERPHALVLYAEYSGLGRAAVAAACSQGIPSFAVQHGILYPRLYANEHAKHEMGPGLDGVDSIPIPTRTAVFGNLARQLLIERGNYPSERIVITGSPKFDVLVEAGRHFDKAATRRRRGLREDAPMLVVASRFVAIGSEFAELVRAAEVIEDLWLLVKPHQAERPDTYERIGRREGASRLRVLPPKENLLELLFASNGLITVDPFASSEALVLGLPVLLVNLPSNLSALVDRGVAVGVRRGESMKPKLRRLLFDHELGRELKMNRKKYIEEFAFGADGSSTTRIVRAIREVTDEAVPNARRQSS